MAVAIASTHESTLAAPGAPFELVQTAGPRGPVRSFRHAPATMPDFLRSLAVHSTRPLLVYEERRLSYGDMFARAAAVAHELHARGATRGSRVAIAMRNSPECVSAILGTFALGAVPVLVNSRSARAELLNCVRLSRAPIVLADKRCAAELHAAEFGGGDLLEETMLAELAPRDDFFEQLARGIQPEDPAAILFTSGTSGSQKAAVLSHRGVLSSIWSNLYASALIGLRTAEKLGVDLATLAAKAPSPCLLLVYPLFHTSGLHSGLLTTLARGARCVLMKRWTGGDALRLIATERITQAPGVPTMFWDMLNVPDRERFDLSSLTSIGTGGQAMPVNLLRELRTAFSRAVIGNGYGLTEANGAVSLVVGEDFLARPTTSGHILPTVDVKFMRDASTEAAPGEPGEIWVRGATVMREYFDDPAATSEAFCDGWLRTGDVGFCDTDGFLYIVDRSKDMIISGGENVYCAEVERVLLEHPRVREATTFGVIDDRLGEKLVAVIVTRDGRSIEEAETQEWVAARLAAYKVPRHVWNSDTPLPRNDMDKIDKIAIRKRYAENHRS